jgi:hypothetical protein
MTDPTLAAATRAAAHPIQRLGATWMLHPEQFEASLEAGYEHPFAGYFAGRGGLLGDADAAVVDAVLGIFGPGVTDTFWPMGVPVHGTRGGAELYFRQAAEWGRTRLAGVVGLGRFIALGEKVIDAAPKLGLPLFAAQSGLPRVDDEPGRAMQVAVLLRELRFGIHLAAMTAAGMPMLEAHLLNQGEEYAAMLGFPGPYPDTEAFKGRAAAVEEATNVREAEIWALALTAEEAAELSGTAARLYDRIRAEDPAQKPGA